MSDEAYYVLTWDTELQSYTPQIGCSPGPYTLWGLRLALKRLHELGYSINREMAWAILVEKRPLISTAEALQLCEAR